MNIKDYSYIHKEKSKYLKDKINFFDNELKEENLFFKFLKETQIPIDDIVPFNFGKKSGAAIYTRDYSLINNFRKISFFEKFDAPYGKEFLSLDINADKIEFYSNVQVDRINLNNFEIRLRDYELISRKYDEILQGVASWKLGYNKKENEKYLLQIDERMKYFKDKGMKQKLIASVSSYLKFWAEGIDPEEDDSR